jgi:signal transduction histidine kinase
MSDPQSGVEPPSAEALIRSLSHAVRGRLSRLHLRVELAELSDAQKAPMLQELNAIDLLLAEHRALVQSAPARPRERVQLASLFAANLSDAGVAAAVALDESLHAECWGWPEVLLGALRPLLRNAWQHGQAPVRLSLVRNTAHWQLCCTDAGSGFDPAALPGLLLPFVHVAGGSHRGAGIGLATARRFAGWMYGELHVEQLHPGFRVSLVLPNALLLPEP